MLVKISRSGWHQRKRGPASFRRRPRCRRSSAPLLPPGSPMPTSPTAGSTISDADAAVVGKDAPPPEFYDPELDDRDAAWVQKMRR